jgi:protein tyrosine phosphatase
MDRWTGISGTNNYRSARIHSFEQLRMVKEKYGIKIVLNLAMDSMSRQSDPGRSCGGLQRPCEPIWAAELGLIYHKVYLGAKPPREEDWQRIQGYLKSGDTLVHCTHGVDRTGAVVGKWQHIVDPSLSREELMDYTTSFGGQWKLGGDPNRFLRAWMLEDVAG